MLDTIPNSLAIRANTYSFSNDEKKRREGALINKDYFYGRQEQYLNKVNEDVDSVTINLTNPVISKRSSLLYTRPLVREFDGPASSVAALERIYDILNMDEFLHMVDLSAELTGTAVIFVGINEEDPTLPEFRIYDASDFSVLTEDDKKTLIAMQIISINDLIQTSGNPKTPNISVKRVIDSEVWTNNYIYKIRDGIVSGNTERNELGYIPFVSFKAQEVINQYLGHSPANSVRQMNSSYNQTATNLSYMIKMQSATPIVLNGFQNGEGISIHPGTAISLPVGASAGALSLNPKISETMEFLTHLEDKIYDTSNVPKVSVLGEDKQSNSGFELLVKWAPLKSVYNDKSNRYETYELNLANMILARMGMDPIVNIKVHYPEDYLPADTERVNLIDDINLGIRSPIDEVIKLNPNLTEAEAEAIVLSNLGFNRQLEINSGSVEPTVGE